MLLFNWPILSILNDKDPFFFFTYLYVLWALIIVLVFLTRKSEDKETPPPDGDRNV